MELGVLSEQIPLLSLGVTFAAILAVSVWQCQSNKEDKKQERSSSATATSAPAETPTVPSSLSTDIDDDAVSSDNLHAAFPRIGVKLRFFDQFLSSHGGRRCFANLTTEEVVEKFIKPQTDDLKGSMCEFLTVHGYGEMVGEAEVYISHAWKQVFLETVDALQYHFHDNLDVFLWLDIFSVNQHADKDLDTHWLLRTFPSAIGGIQHTVVVSNSWQQPVFLSRTWCLYEIFCSVQCQAKFGIAFSRDHRRQFLKLLCDDTFAVLDVLASRAQVDHSECSKLQDREMLLTAIQSAYGLSRFNDIVLDQLREWMLFVVQRELERRPSHPPAMSLALKMALADLYCSQGKYHLAEALHIEYYEIMLSRYGEDHSYTLDAMNNLAVIYGHQGKADLAEPLYQRGISTLRTRLAACSSSSSSSSSSSGSTSTILLDLVDWLHNYATLCEDQGRYPQAEPLLVECLQHRQALHGRSHPDSCQSLYNLAIHYCRAGDYPKAEDCLQTCTSLRSAALGGTAVETLVCYTSLAWVYRYQKKWTQALDCYRLVTAGYEKVLGPCHVETLASYYHCTTVYLALGELPAAEKAFFCCLQRCLHGGYSLQALAASPASSSTSSSSNNSSSSASSSAGSANSSSSSSTSTAASGTGLDLPALWSSLLAAYEDRSNSTSDTSSSRSSNSSSSAPATTAESSTTTSSRPRRVCEQVYALYVSRLGEDHLDTLHWADQLASLYRHQALLPQAEALYLSTLRHRRRLCGDNHRSTLAAMNNLALVLYEQNKTEYVEALLSECYTRRREVLGEKHVETLASLQNLALWYEEAGKLTLAEGYYHHAWEIASQLYGEDDSETWSALHDLAVVYEGLGRWRQAEEIFDKVYLHHCAARGPTDGETLTSLHDLAIHLDEAGQWAKAREKYEACLQGMIALRGRRHIACLEVAQDLARLCIKMGAREEGVDRLRQLVQEMREVRGERHEDTLRVMQDLAQALAEEEKEKGRRPGKRGREDQEEGEKEREVEGEERQGEGEERDRRVRT